MVRSQRMAEPACWLGPAAQRVLPHAEPTFHIRGLIIDASATRSSACGHWQDPETTINLSTVFDSPLFSRGVGTGDERCRPCSEGHTVQMFTG